MNQLPVPDGVHFSAHLPLVWHGVWQQSAFEATRYLAVLAEFESTSDERSHAQDALHAKLDLMLLWTAKNASHNLPAAKEVVIGLETISWRDVAALPVGAHGALAISLSQVLPFSLQLPAEIVACVGADQAYTVTARLLLKEEALRDWFERTVFRNHRHIVHAERGAQT
ncbi:PilZ domain-containing protein [Iodobacter arcticus]|uniref:PilZ domain-containing protein n=1 Tax=Iodobacter arcticus TaxID=590593 RepID=A0ABW2R1M0_9NEIS